MNRTGRTTIWAATLVLAASVAACGGSSDNQPKVSGDAAFGDIPAAAEDSRDGGEVNVALTPGATPSYIYPNSPAVFNGSVIAVGQLWRPLYWRSTGATSATNEDLSLAEAPAYSDGGKTVTIELKDDYTWSDGEPVVADDLIFSIELIRAAVKESPSNWSYYTPGQFPDDLVSVEAADANTVTLVLKNAYNPDYLSPSSSISWSLFPPHAWSQDLRRGTDR